jgi:hypothetical protein
VLVELSCGVQVLSFEETLSEIELDLAAKLCSHTVGETLVVGGEKAVLHDCIPNQITSTAS